MKQLLAIFIFVLLLSSCRSRSPQNVMYDKAGSVENIPVTRQSANTPMPPVEEAEKQEVNKKKIIKDGRLGLQVKALEKTKLHIDTLLKKYDGYYDNESFNNTDLESSYSLKIRIPSTNFEKFVAEIESGDGEVLYKEIDARDVTDQFVDLETRLANKRSYLKRYNDLLKQAKTIKEILEIEEKIRGIEEEIESATGRLNYLSDQVDYSTLDLLISKSKEYKFHPDNRDRFSEQLKQSLSKGWFVFVDFVLLLLKIWPFWVIVVLIIYFWRKYKKHNGKK